MAKSVDLTGRVIEQLTVLRKDLSVKKGSGVSWICECSCGNMLSIKSSALGWKKSCGCQNTEMRKINVRNMGRKNKQDVKKRFFKYVDKTNSCWNWTGDIGIGGYGRFWHNGRTVYAHRFSYQKHKGKIPDGLLVCHDCDNPKCINPDHLFLGTNQDNSNDMLKKGRQPRGRRLNSKKVSDIIQLLNKNEKIVNIAEKYGIGCGCIRSIKYNKSWKHVKRN